MPQSFFIWNGTDCRAKGVILRGPAPIIRAEERVKHVEIPGRSGDLTQTERDTLIDAVYNSYIQTVTISVRSAFRVREIYKWLRGDGYITFSGEPNVRQRARVIGAITLNRVSRNIDHWAGEVQFYCQPFKERLKNELKTITTSGTKIRNDGDVTAKPLYRVTTSGSSISLTVAGSTAPEGNTLAVVGLTANDVIWIDSETLEIWDEGHENTMTEKSTGNFPVLGTGENTLTFTGCSSIQIDMRERFL